MALPLQFSPKLHSKVFVKVIFHYDYCKCYGFDEISGYYLGFFQFSSNFDFLFYFFYKNSALTQLQ